MNSPLLEKQQALLADSLQGKTIAVSGATGLVGRAVVRYLMSLNDIHQADISVVALCRDVEKWNQTNPVISERTDVNAVVFEAETPFTYDGKVDYIIHAAGISGGSKMHLKDPLKIYDIGINGTRTLLDYASSHGCVGFLYVSTYEIYGEVNQEDMITENHACQLNPMVLRNSYAEVKRLCESMLVAYHAKFGFNVYSARLTSTFGTGVSVGDPRFFAEFARCVVSGRDIVLKSTGGTVRNYLDVDDAASAFLYILAYGETCQAYNLTNRNNAVSVRDIAQRLIELNGSKVKLVFDIAEDVSTLGFRKEGVTKMDPSKIEAIGWSPVYTLDETLVKLSEVFKTEK